ncbi:MAG TPA: hypothetical protein VF281_03325 [Candidatus Saccharimonadales bacterium]
MSKSYEQSPLSRQQHSIKQEVYLSSFNRSRLNNDIYRYANLLEAQATPTMSTQSLKGITTLEQPPEGMLGIVPPTRHQLSMSRGFKNDDDQYFFAIHNGTMSFSTSPKAGESTLGYWEAKIKNTESTHLISTARLITYLSERLPADKQSALSGVLDQITDDSVESANHIFDALSEIAPSRIDIDHYKAQDILFHETEGLSNNPNFEEDNYSAYFESTVDFELRIMKPYDHTMQYDLIMQAPVSVDSRASVNKKYQYSLSVPNNMTPENHRQPQSAANAQFTSIEASQEILRRIAHRDRSSQAHYDIYKNGLDFIVESHLGQQNELLD